MKDYDPRDFFPKAPPAPKAPEMTHDELREYVAQLYATQTKFYPGRPS